MGQHYYLPPILAQNNGIWCATTDDNTPDLDGVFSYSDNLATAQSIDPIVLNVFYWQVNSYNGENEDPLTLETVLASVAQLNLIFNNFNIFFKYRGFDEIDSPSGTGITIIDDNGNVIPDPDGYGILDVAQRHDLWNYASNNGFEQEDAINIYVPYGVTRFAGASNGTGNNMLVMPTVNIHGGILHHEMGHALGLSHTHIGYNGGGCERVTRNPGDMGYNADTHGDKVTDTAAVPNFISEYCFFDDPTADCSSSSEFNKYYVDEELCTYTGENSDCDGTPYDIANADVRNFMSYSHRSCFDTFSPGQAIRMQERILSDSDLISTQTTIASLYEPYFGEYYLAGSTNDKPVLFQPGFDYAFHPCSGNYNEPSDYEDTSFTFKPAEYFISKYTSDYEAITHPNKFSIGILHPALDSQPRKCYNNTNRTPISGNVVKFEDGVINYNVSITPKDSLGINQENLINTLNPGLYKIEENFDNGDIKQTIIQKNNE